MEIAEWLLLEKGDKLISAGKPLNDVVYLHKGYAVAGIVVAVDFVCLWSYL